MQNRERMSQADLRRVAQQRRAIEKARLGMEAAIRDARASGETYRDIAEAAGLSYQRVWQIVNDR